MAAELGEKIEQLQKARDTAQEKSVQLEAANRELMKLDELKSDFLANISHELKAPLVSTKGYIDFILSAKLGPVNEKQIKGLIVSRDNLNHLSRLITSLLDFSKASSGLLKLHMESCSLSQIIESCVASVSLEAKRKNKDLQFVSNLPDHLPLIFADPDRVREVLMNLLLNAEKFTHKGVVKISVDVPSPTDEYLNVHVTDNGIGIPKGHLSRIFNRFYQVDGSSTRKYGGTGLGLAIVKEIIEAHRCRIHVESEEGIGSRFSFTLPILRQTTAVSPARKLKLRSGKHHASKLVEVVEDDPNIGGLIKSLLEEEGFAVIQAHTGQDALAIAKEHHPDLITLDIYLPDVNGFDLLSQLHAEGSTTDIPIIVLSIVMDKEQGFRLGAADYLEKPIDVNKLRESVLRISRAIDGIQGPMKIMIADDDVNTVEFLQDLLSAEGYQVCSNLGGKEAVAKARLEKPDLILLDLVMPDLDGLDVLQQLKTETDTRNIPVIVLTGKARIDDRDRSLLLGAQDFLMKPVELKQIVDQVKRYFGAPDA